MPAITSIVLADAAATPLNHTFDPVSVTRDNNNYDVGTLQNRAPGVAIGYESLAVSLRAPAPQTRTAKLASDATSRVYRGRVKLQLPVMEVTAPSTGSGIQPAPTVAYVMDAEITFLIPERSTLQNRKDLVKLATQAITSTTVKSVFEDLAPLY